MIKKNILYSLSLSYGMGQNSVCKGLYVTSTCSNVDDNATKKYVNNYVVI